MSRRPNHTRRVTRARLEVAKAEVDQHTKANVTRTLEAYHAEHVEPLQRWANLPWWKRLWVKP